MGDALIRALLLGAADRMDMLRAINVPRLPDAWLAAGAIRNLVWDHLHGHMAPTPLADADVIWFHPDGTRDDDERIERELAALLPGVPWQVRNQARMHHRNNHAPYTDCADAMRRWTETATAIGARLAPDGGIALLAPYGTGDLLSLKLRPPPGADRAVYQQRIAAKDWLRRWPRLVMMAEAEGPQHTG
jgi:uncharacterized protein